MTQEEKSLLLKDLCARWPYGVFLKIGEYSDYTLQGLVHSNTNKPLVVRYNGADFGCSIEVVKPYLRPISSMTEEEDLDWQYYKNTIAESCDERLEERISELHDWFNAHHFDYRGLIPKGLALEASKDMYKFD